MTRKKIIQHLLLMVLLTASFSMQAQKALTVKENNGTVTNFAVSSIRKITFYSGNMQILCSTGMKQYVLADLQYAAFIKQLFSISAENVSLAATAGSKDSVTVTSNVSWTASCNQPWLTITPTVLTTGNEKIRFTAAVNPTVVNRTAIISLKIGDIVFKTITVEQLAGAATLGLSTPTIGTTKLANSNATLAVTSNTVWTAVSDQQWLTPTPTDSGNGTLTLTVQANPTTASRKAIVTVSAVGATSKTVTVTQAAGDAALSISATTASIAKDANSTATVDVTSNVTWTASTSQSWLSLSPNTATTGNATLTITAEANPSITTRKATITISGSSVSSKTITVTQVASSATLSLSAKTTTLAKTAGSTDSVQVYSNTSWSASSSQSWLSFGNANGLDTAYLSFTATANPSIAKRTATVTVSATGVTSQTLTVTQNPGDTVLSVSATEATIKADASNPANITVTSNAEWLATTADGWITVNPAVKTNGNAPIGISASANTTVNQRVGTVTVTVNAVKKHTITVTQEAFKPLLSLPSATAAIDATAGSTVQSDITSNVAWTAESDQSWLTINTPTGSGNATLTFTAGVNPGLSTREATVTIASAAYSLSKTITVTQAAGSPTLNVSASAVNISKSEGSTAEADVTSNTTWKATTAQTWLSVLPAGATTGDATLSFTATVNKTILPRVAEVTVTATGVPAQTIIVTQAAGDPALSLSASNTQASKTAGTTSFTIVSNTKWTISSDQTWLTLSNNGIDSADATIQLSYTSNGNISPRNATVTVSASGVASQTFVVNQAHGDTILMVNPNKVTLACIKGSTTKIDITSNTTWTANSDQSWLSVSPSAPTAGNGTLIMTASANAGTKRTATVTVSANGIASKTIEVSQDAFTPTIKVTALVNKLPAKGGDVDIRIVSNTNWTISSNQSWASCKTSQSKGDSIIKISVSPNTSAVRSATITFTATGLGDTTITLSQADTIMIKKAIADTSLAIDGISNKYLFTAYFSYGGAGTVSYQVSSDNVTKASPVISGASFGLIPYSAGTANISVRAVSTSGAMSGTVIFKVVVTSSSTVSCSSFMVIPVKTEVTCHGGTDGSLFLSPKGGTKPYTYKWSTGRTDNTIANVPAGTYTVLVTDSNTCTRFETYTITEPSALVITPSVINPKCGEGNGEVSVAVTGGTSSYNYKWSSGSTSTKIENLFAGQYTLTVTDGKSCKTVQTISVGNTNAPVATVDTVVPSTCKQASGAITLSVIGGTLPYSYIWNDGNTNKDRSTLQSGNYSLTITDKGGCKTTLKTTVPSKSFTPPSIALVTVSDTTGKNLVVWLKEKTDAINYYTIYRETFKAGEYEEIGTVPYSSRSVYRDETADAQDQSWRYKISATDYCGNETPLSKEHKTIYLQKNLGMNKVINLDWDSYEGIDFYTYSVYRLSKSKGLELIKRIPSSITRYTDQKPLGDVKSYYVAIELPATIDSMRLKSDSGPFSVSISNLAESELSGISDKAVSDIQIYPNPASESFSVSNITSAQITIFNLTGIEILIQTIKENELIPLKGWQKGMYHIKIQTGSEVVSKTLVVE